jgi:hypothetical protein
VLLNAGTKKSFVGLLIAENFKGKEQVKAIVAASSSREAIS